MSESLIQLAIQLTRIFVSIIIVIGVVGNVLSIVILTRRALIHHACPDGYQLDPTKYLTSFWKVISYLLNLCPTLSVYFIVPASMDRYCASSINVQRRNLNNLRVARRAIGIIVAILKIFFVGTLIAFDILLYHFV